ncbi:Antimicrobial protein MiAMP1 [Macleaya cordata]|uniref:Antimicrobial protein MiAMP1 n=1 Tax=Macleaya cordata TaxID=56857 RepID=A0A200RB17_MACCD|nr:Antimicrobial protein MiAMP1 [Macleaya cordata]
MAANKNSITSSIVYVFIMAVLFVSLMSGEFANASYMTVWSGPGCNNFAERYSNCGCTAINQHGGYEFVYQGQTAALYNQDGCQGVAHTRLHSDAGQCTGFGWNSIFIQC